MEAFKRKTRKYIGLLPILGGGGYPQPIYFQVFPEEKKHLTLKNDLYAQEHVKSE